ncbi:hypothetical protein HK100_011951 [Physocladia obscura]|uniref:Response regulatory domain-containing protein n=1 Tax=Physocladia obscura TaxID=109957 RepID=A0AAD5XKL8_9FUNG|nr:hypothetical protein HK100_011951 [Physocladia obscura]
MSKRKDENMNKISITSSGISLRVPSLRRQSFPGSAVPSRHGTVRKQQRDAKLSVENIAEDSSLEMASSTDAFKKNLRPNHLTHSRSSDIGARNVGGYLGFAFAESKIQEPVTNNDKFLQEYILIVDNSIFRQILKGIMFSDLEMPQVDGLVGEMAKKLKDLGFTIPIIIITGSKISRDDSQKFIQANIVEIVSKPVTKEKTTTLIQMYKNASDFKNEIWPVRVTISKPASDLEQTLAPLIGRSPSQNGFAVQQSKEEAATIQSQNNDDIKNRNNDHTRSFLTSALVGAILVKILERLKIFDEIVQIANGYDAVLNNIYGFRDAWNEWWRGSYEDMVFEN